MQISPIFVAKIPNFSKKTCSLYRHYFLVTLGLGYRAENWQISLSQETEFIIYAKKGSKDKIMLQVGSKEQH